MSGVAPWDAIPVEVFDTTRCELGEGCGYDLDTDTVWWFDILGRKLFQGHFSSRRLLCHDLPVMGSAGAFIDDNRQLIASDQGLHVRERASGQLSFLRPIEPDKPGNRSNDGRAHPCGAFWIGTMGRNAERGAGAIYHFHRGELGRLYAGISIPNAICFSPDGTTAYFADTRAGILNRVAIDPATALPTSTPQMLHDHRSDIGGLDGGIVDAEGLIWIACWGGGCIQAYTPDGLRVRNIPVPAKQPSCPVFVGPDLEQLIVTSAFEGMDSSARKVDPGHGQTFLLTFSVRGLPGARCMFT